MIHGLDTGFLVAVEVVEHPAHAAARTTLSELVGRADRLALAPQILAEFIHIVTDPRRFSDPLKMSNALTLARRWWTAKEVDHAFPDFEAELLFLNWMGDLHLGRKRLLDTLLAATYFRSGIKSVLTTNPADFALFNRFALITPGGKLPEMS